MADDPDSFGPDLFGGGLGRLVKQVKDLQGKVQEAAQRAQAIEAEGAAAAGLVTARANSRGEVVALTIEPELLARGDAGLLADLIRGAVNGALRAAGEKAKEEMSGVAGGLDLGALLRGGQE